MGCEKFIMDVAQAGMLPTWLAGVDMSGNGQAMDPIRQVGPGELPPVRTQVPTASGRLPGKYLSKTGAPR